MSEDQARLELAFHEAMVDIYRRALKECRYNASYLIGMVGNDGGLTTARRLLATDEPLSGYIALYECGRLDLTVEALVVCPMWTPLFTEEERSTARRRLEAYGFDVDRHLVSGACDR